MYRDRDVWVRYPGDPAPYYDSPGIRSDYGGGVALLAIIFLIVFFMWYNGYWFGGTPATVPAVNTVTIPATSPVITPLAEVRTVIADELNMRVEPSNYGPVLYVLPRGTRVTVLGETHQEYDGDIWVKVRVATLDGLRYGWVSQQYIA